MRLAILIALGAAFLAAPSLAQSVPTTPLGANEVLLEINASGEVHRPATRARLRVQLIGRGASDREARAALEQRLQRLASAARAAGVDAGDIQTVSPTPMGFIGNEA
jgi:uncharacterized protein YggE